MRNDMFKFGNKQIRIAELCIYSFLILTIILFLYSYSHILFLVRMAIMILGALSSALFVCFKRKGFHLPWLLSFSLLLFWVMSAIGQEHENLTPTNLLYTMCYIWLAVVVLRNEYSHKASIAIMAFGLLTIIARILRGVSFNSILLANSSNYVSILLITLILFYYISCHDKQKRPWLIPAYLLFFVSIYATGRGGILCSGFLSVAMTFYRLQTIKNKNIKRVLWVWIVMVVFITIMYLSDAGKDIMEKFLMKVFSRFYKKGTLDESRSKIWSTFFSNNMRSARDFFLGSDTQLIRSDGNLHNSFLQAYASFGFGGFLLIVFLTVRSFLKGIRYKDYLWLILYFALILRAFTDRVFFQGYAEFLFFYFLFYWDYRKPSRYPEIIQEMVQ